MHGAMLTTLLQMRSIVCSFVEVGIYDTQSFKEDWHLASYGTTANVVAEFSHLEGFQHFLRFVHESSDLIVQHQASKKSESN
jgi:hypothetical protein